MDVTRRRFLKQAAAGTSALLLPFGGASLARADEAGPVLVVIFLRGGADWMNLIVPRAEPLYYANRPRVAMPADEVLDLDGFFAMNPGLTRLHALFQNGDLGVLHAVGSHDRTRSHFDAQDFMEKAAPGNKSVSEGWLNRYLGLVAGGDPVAGVSMNTAKAKALSGPAPAIAMTEIAEFAITWPYQSQRIGRWQERYGQLQDTVLGKSLLEALAALDRVAAVDPSATVAYPATKFATGLQQAAALIRARIGTRIVTVDLSGWDTHSGESEQLQRQVAELDLSLASFWQDLGAEQSRTLVMVMSEFGRSLAENGGFGTDHGHGGAMLLLGSQVAGGQVHGTWPGLEPADLFEGRDLEVTTDFRDLFAEVLSRHLGLADPSPIFPGFTPAAARFPGLLG